jgi:uncharacterized protein YuzE
MKITYDTEGDILYIRLVEGALIDVSSEPVPGLVLDHDAAGRVAGLELMQASRTVSPPFPVETSILGDPNSVAARVVREARRMSPEDQVVAVAARWPNVEVVDMTTIAKQVEATAATV